MDKKEEGQGLIGKVCCGLCGKEAVEAFLLPDDILVIRCADPECRKQQAVLAGYPAEESEGMILISCKAEGITQNVAGNIEEKVVN